MLTRTGLWALVGFVLIGVVGYAGATDPPKGDTAATASTVSLAFALDEPVEFQLKSEDVVWRGQIFNLLRVAEATFSLDEDARLTASLKAGSTTFDDVEYTIHAAVFDREGQLLGTASTVCQVQRVWIGVLAHMRNDLALDFGISKRYDDAATVMLTISSVDVQTPDDWQE